MPEICRVPRLSHTQLKNKSKQHDPFTIKSDTPFYEIAMPSIKHQQTDICSGQVFWDMPQDTLINLSCAESPLTIQDTWQVINLW